MALKINPFCQDGLCLHSLLTIVRISRRILPFVSHPSGTGYAYVDSICLKSLGTTGIPAPPPSLTSTSSPSRRMIFTSPRVRLPMRRWLSLPFSCSSASVIKVPSECCRCGWRRRLFAQAKRISSSLLSVCLSCSLGFASSLAYYITLSFLIVELFKLSKWPYLPPHFSSGDLMLAFQRASCGFRGEESPFTLLARCPRPRRLACLALLSYFIHVNARGRD